MSLIKFLLVFIISLNVSAAFIVSSDWHERVNQERVPGYSLINKFGWTNVANTTHSQLWNSPTGADMIYPTVGETLSVSSANVNDTIAGTGARTIYLECLDSVTWETVTQIINLAGTTPVVTTINCIRFQRGWVTGVGTYGGKSLGLITITGTDTGNPYGYIETEDSRTENTQYTIPAGKTGYMKNISLSVDSSKLASFSLHKRENADVFTAPYGATTAIHLWDGITGANSDSVIANHKFPEKTDIYLDAQMTSGTGTIAADYDLLIVDN